MTANRFFGYRFRYRPTLPFNGHSRSTRLLTAPLGVMDSQEQIADETIALLAPFALLLRPDASTYGFRNGFFWLHWLLFTVPGSGWGLGVAFAALALCEVAVAP